MISVANAGTPLWTFEALTPTTVAVPFNAIASVQYRVTNQSNRSHTLVMQSIPGVLQVTSGAGVCSNPFVLAGHASCTLSLQIIGSELNRPISDGPIICQQGGLTNQCYRPAAAEILQITQTPSADTNIAVSGSPLSLIAGGPTGSLIITNMSSDITATNITSNFTGTALEGLVTETGNTCASVAPNSSCTLTYTPGNTDVSLTSFTIKGDNTNSVTAQIGIYVATLTSGTTDGGTSSIVLIGAGLDSIWVGGSPYTYISHSGQTSCTSATTYSQLSNINLVYGTAGQTNTGWAPDNVVTAMIYYSTCLKLCTNFARTSCTNSILIN
jgi:hypothetical protein